MLLRQLLLRDRALQQQDVGEKQRPVQTGGPGVRQDEGLPPLACEGATARAHTHTHGHAHTRAHAGRVKVTPLCVCVFRSLSRTTETRSESWSSSSGPTRCTYVCSLVTSSATLLMTPPHSPLAPRGQVLLKNIVPFVGNKMKYGCGVRSKGFSEGMWEIQNTPGVGSKPKVSVFLL